MRRYAAVIAYDIVCDKRRRRVFRCLQAWSLSAQYSVFECDLSKPEAEELFIQLSEIIAAKEDSLMLAWLDNRRKPKAVTKATQIGFQIPALYAG